jgi:hypothetical protein
MTFLLLRYFGNISEFYEDWLKMNKPIARQASNTPATCQDFGLKAFLSAGLRNYPCNWL